MEKVERREMKTERLNIKETLPTVRLKTYSAHGSYMQCKCKRKWKCKRVHTFNANARKERYASARSIFPRWPTMIELLPIARVGSERKYKLQKMKMFHHTNFCVIQRFPALRKVCEFY